jgi:predicted metal-dependent hydrolase
LKHLHHGKEFWDCLAEQIPKYEECVRELRAIDKAGHAMLTM